MFPQQHKMEVTWTEIHVPAVLQMNGEGLSQVWWTPTDCSGNPTWILLSNITYDITPPSLALLLTSGSTTKTVATSQSSSTSEAPDGLWHRARRLHFFSISPSSSSSSSKTYGANVVFSFSEPVTGFAQQYAFVKGGTVAGLNESVSGQNFSTAIVAESASTASMLILVTGSKRLQAHSHSRLCMGIAGCM